MKISFPYMGCVTAYKKVFELLGHEVIMPQKPTKGTVDLGVKYSPEFICFPFKVMLGTYIECAEKGAEIIVTSGGNGPCRAGLYPDIHQRILKELGYNVEIIVFDSLFRDVGAFIRKLKILIGNTPVYKIPSKAAFVLRLVNQMDSLEKELKILRAYEKKAGDFNSAWKKIVNIYENCYKNRDLKLAYKKAKELLHSIPIREVEDSKRRRVGIVGEIYVIMESSVNMNVEEVLNSMGIEVENVQYISDWIKHNMQPKWLYLTKSKQVLNKAKPYAPINCGGHDMENLGWIVDFKERGFDGVIHLMPFGCLPELVNRSKVPVLSDKLDIPILSLSLDEQMGEAHAKTRVEAFVDLILSRVNSNRLSLQSINAPVKAEQSNVYSEAKNEPVAAGIVSAIVGTVNDTKRSETV